MRKTLTPLGPRGAAYILLAAMGALVVYHVLMIAGVLPAEAAWGGRAAASRDRLVALETVALLVTLIFAAFIAAKGGLLRARALRRIGGVGVWIVFAYLILNCVGNLASPTPVERWILAPATVVLALLALRLAVARLPDPRVKESEDGQDLSG